MQPEIEISFAKITWFFAQILEKIWRNILTRQKIDAEEKYGFPKFLNLVVRF